jgi:hypothetical protein
MEGAYYPALLCTTKNGAPVSSEKKIAKLKGQMVQF